ncbi:T9SS type A sorting domain-containing protein [Niastella sp. OAS944]|uniref:T9SS type A sorting domain-containing protein n=1 Tax=Niastella sp. OAS944 TaxID=2664089 RepID=UPI003471E851|nr:hypothetical protein [Chitinophagaceae bacterium OAS944]
MKSVYPNARPMQLAPPVSILFFLILLSVQTSHSQTFNAPVRVVNPFDGTGGQAGSYYPSLRVVNGNPAIAFNDETHTNLTYVRANDADGSSWGAPIWVDSSGSVGRYSSMEIVNGFPAIAYYYSGRADLNFVRATNANGTAWGTPITIQTAGNIGEYATLQVVNGLPAIAYYDATNGDLKYIQATDANGTSWGTPVTVDGSGTDNVGTYISMQVINGFPAMSYYDVTNRNLKYVRATDANGSSWGVPFTVDASTASVGLYSSLQTINGFPAIAYSDATNEILYFVRATDANGGGWGAPVNTGMGYSAYFSLNVINGLPAISYFRFLYGRACYVQATDVNGTSWGASVLIDAAGSTGTYSCLQVVNGMPAIAYYDQNNTDLKYVRATNVNGTTWATPQTFDVVGITGLYISLQLVNGNPAMAYYDDGNDDLKYARANDAGGFTWATQKSPDVIGNTGLYPSLQVVNGNPAIAYYTATTGDLKFVRAVNADGTGWSIPATVDNGGTADVGYYARLQLVNNLPAIAYFDNTNKVIKFIRATNADGTAWGTPITIAGTNTQVTQISFQMVNGFPAIAYVDNTNGDLKYVQATDANGTLWGTPITVDNDNVGDHLSLQIVDGFPAIAYYYLTGRDLKFIRATNANGTAWGTALTLDATSDVGAYPSLQIMNSYPAVSYYDATSYKLKFIRATNASGTTWGTPVRAVNTGENLGSHASMISSGTGAAIAYYSEDNYLPYFVTSPGFVLPVTITRFAAQWKNTAVQLDWQVADESSIERYIIERSADGSKFATLATVTATNTNGSHSYNYPDASPLAGVNYYRLRIEEAAGNVRYSSIVSLKGNNNATQYVSVQPNPVKNNTLQFEASLSAGAYTLQVVNSAGVTVSSTRYQHNGGTAVQTIPVLSQLASGVYHLVITSNKTRVTGTFVK